MRAAPTAFPVRYSTLGMHCDETYYENCVNETAVDGCLGFSQHRAVPVQQDRSKQTDNPNLTGTVEGLQAYLAVASNGCWAIADGLGISLDDLYAWNPALDGSCSGLRPDYTPTTSTSASDSPLV
ncbi:hypothetical protein LX36DRAFT_709681 [Colletotrichum falcatum]|nr:hypothetical protein LX36DRAFT_709681 [Colletotrichum falcatum]